MRPNVQVADARVAANGTASLFAALRSGAGRRRFYAVISILGFASAIIVTLGRVVVFGANFNLATGDGKDYYVYLASVLVDGDLDFANQMREHYGREFEPRMLDHRTPRGYVADKYPIGVALTLAPPAVLAHAICLPVHRLTGWRAFAPDGYSLPYQLLILAWIEFLGFCTLVMVDTLICKRVGGDGRWVALGIGCIALGSPYLFHFFTNPVAAHTAGVFWVTATIALAMRASDECERHRRLPAWCIARLAFCTAMAIVTRPTNVLVLPFLVIVFERILHARLLLRAIALLPLAILFAAPAFLQMWVWHRMFGAWITFSYEANERFFFDRPALWQTLFSTRNGLFVWSPMMLLATIGLIWQLVRSPRSWQNEFVLCAAGSFAILWYFNSSWWAWWFGESWGGRAFIEVLLIFMIGMTWLIEHIATLRDDARRAWIGAIGGSIIWTTILLFMWYGKQIPRSDYLVPSWRLLSVDRAPANSAMIQVSVSAPTYAPASAPSSASVSATLSASESTGGMGTSCAAPAIHSSSASSR